MAVQIPFPLPSSGFALNSKMRINLDFLVGQFNQFNTGTATWDTVAIGTANNLTGTLTFYNASNANYLTFQPGVTSTNTTYTWPTTAAGGLLSSTTLGVMSWTGVPSLNNAIPLIATSGAVTYSSIAYNVTSASNGLVYVPAGGTQVTTLANALGAQGILAGSSAGTPKFVSLLGTSNQVVITTNTTDYTLSTPQDIGTSSNVTFNRVTAAGGSAANPAVQVIFSGAASNTGIWSASGTELDLSVAGATRFSLDNTGLAIATGEFRAATVQATTALKLVTASGPRLTMQTASSGGTPYTITWPNAVGAANTVLSTDNSGNLSWVSVSAIGGASNALDNLASVAVNLSLLPGTDNSIDLGSGSKQWKNLFLSSTITAVTGTFSGTVSGAVFKDTTAGAASAGTIRLANGSTINWRNAGGTGDYGITSTAGDVLLMGAPIQSTAATFTAGTNQLVLGSTRTVTITAPIPATSSRTHTIPDVSASASFVMTEGAQTINGNKTISGTTNLSGLTISLPLQLDGSKNITSTAIDLSTSQVTGNLGVAHLNSGTSASATTFWCGDGSWKGISAAGGATKALDNLASTAVNTHILPASADSVNLGSNSLPFLNFYTGLIQVGRSGLAGTIALYPLTALKGSTQITMADCSGSTTTTMNFAGQGGARTYTVPDAGASASFVMTAGTQTIAGSTTLSAAAGNPLHGTNTNDSASAGYTGEYIESIISVAANFPTNNQWGDMTSISLTAGDWDVVLIATFNGATGTTYTSYGISQTTGNSATGLVTGSNRVEIVPEITGNGYSGGNVSPYRQSLSGTTVIYAKVLGTYSGTAPLYRCRLSARRVR